MSTSDLKPLEPQQTPAPTSAAEARTRTFCMILRPEAGASAAGSGR